MAEVPQSVSNFLVPAVGSTNAIAFNEIFSSEPKTILFATYSLSGIPFRPYGVVIDNTQADGPLTVEIVNIGYNIVCPAGSAMQVPYPAPLNHSARITGDGEASVIFVDYPVFPFYSSNGGNAVDIVSSIPLGVFDASNALEYVQAVVTVTNTSAEVLAENEFRKYLCVQNNGAGNIYVNFGAAATANHLRIAPGGSYISNNGAPGQSIFCIGAIASNPNVVIIEG